MTQMKYIWKEIKENRILFLLFLIMNVVMLYFMGNLLHMLKDSKQRMDSVLQFEKGYENAYMVVDHTTEQELGEMWNDEENTKEKFRHVLRQLYAEDITFFTEYGYEMDPGTDGMTISQQVVSQNFFDLYAISVLEGRIFTEEEYSKKAEVVPVIIGYELQNQYDVGEEYEFENGGDGTTFKGKVIGVLKKNTSFCELSNYQVPISLEHSYLIPMVEEGVSQMSLSDLDMATTRMVLFGDKNAIQRIFSLAGLESMSLRAVTEQVHLVVEEETSNIKNIIGITIAILILTLTVAWIGFQRLFRKNMRNYWIHLFCGARKDAVVLRFVLECGMILSVAWLIACAMFCNGEIALTLLGVVIFVLLAIGIYPVAKVKKIFY